MIAIAALAITFTACKKDSEEPIIVVPPSDGATITLSGKTAESNYTNIVYADLSTDKATAVDRKSWALGFYSGSDFKVLINQSFQSLAQAVNKTDINGVTLDDAKASMVYNISLLSPTLTDAVNLVDNYNGSLNRTAIATVSAIESENKVYILGLNGSYTEPNLYKVRILRNGSAGYTLQYAKVQETTFKTLNISKNAEFNLSFVSLGNNNDGNIVNVEPKKTEWDFHWSYSTYKSVAANPESNPYWYQDFITINSLAGVSAAEVLTTSTLTYSSFAETNLSTIIFLNTRDAIGSNWRSTTGTGIKTDRFYVVKDGAGNIYKLRFVSMGVGNDGGERGKPVIEYKLIKKG